MYSLHRALWHDHSLLVSSYVCFQCAVNCNHLWFSILVLGTFSVTLIWHTQVMFMHFLIVLNTENNVIRTIPVNTDTQKWLKMLYYACRTSSCRCHFVKKHNTPAHIHILLQSQDACTWHHCFHKQCFNNYSVWFIIDSYSTTYTLCLCQFSKYSE